MGTVVIGKYANVTFTSANLYIKNLEIKEGATVSFTQCAVMRVCNHVKLADDVSFNASGNLMVTMFVEKKVEVDEGSTVTANIYSKEDIEVKGKRNDPTTMTGLFIADKVEAEDYVSFYWNTTISCPVPVFNKTELVAQEEGLLDTYFEADVYPNPANAFFNIRLFSSSTEPFSIEVYDMNGRLIESKTTDQTSLYNEMGQAYADGMYFVKIIQGENTKTLRLIKANR